MNKLKNFPTVNFVSIHESYERRKILRNTLNELNLKSNSNIFNRYLDEDHNIIGNDKHLLINTGRGPVTSHLKAIKEWYETTDDPYGFFCEDDISFETVKYWNFTWKEFLNSVPERWECLQLSLTREYIDQFNIPDFVENIKFNLSYFFNYQYHLRNRCWCDWSCVAYLIKRSHAKRLLDSYYYDDSFCLEYRGSDRDTRQEWSCRPVAETLIYSIFDFETVFTFPLFVENSSFESTLISDGESDYNYNCVRDVCSNCILDWWKTIGKDFTLGDIMGIINK